MAQLSEDVRSSLRFFAFFLANGTLVMDLLDEVDYRPVVMAYGSGLEQVFAIFANVLDVDGEGQVTNYGDAEYRAAQWIRKVCDPTYQVDPPFAEWEIELPM